VKYGLRPAENADWPEIRRVADEAAPWAGAHNDTWLAHRKQFEGVRRHYVATNSSGAISGYGAVEQDADDARRCRIFVVSGPKPLRDGAGDALLSRLVKDLRGPGATTAWMREEARDGELLSFATDRGFVETSRFTHDGIEIVILERTIDDSRS
jgi:hypothetical protein